MTLQSDADIDDEECAVFVSKLVHNECLEVTLFYLHCPPTYFFVSEVLSC